MNTNKIVFGIIGALVLALLFLLVTSLNSDSQPSGNKTAAGDFSIWILSDDVGDFSDIISGFKTAYPAYASKNIIVESFSENRTYTNALTSAIISGQGPDIFVQSNGEISPFENQILGVNPSIVSPNDFRLKFKPIFGEDLVVSDPDDSTVEFLKGIPAGYETLGVYYNRKYFLRPSEITNWSDFLKEIQSISSKYSNIIPVALGNGSGVSRSPEIISSLLVLEGQNTLKTVDANQVRQVLGMYNGFGQRDGDNRYNILSAPFETNTDIDYFAQGDVAAMIGYPRDLLEIDKIGYQSSFLFATPFPKYTGADKRTSINYNYFVTNKDTPLGDMSQDFLAYLASDEGQQQYIDAYPYYLSSNVAVSSLMPEKKILPGYNIVYKNFVSDDDELVSFELADKNTFNEAIIPILDMESGYDSEFTKMSSYIICSATKQNTLLSLSSPCK